MLIAFSAASCLLRYAIDFIEARLGEGGGFEWIVPPEERREKEERAQGKDKERPPEAPTLRRKPNPNR